MMLVVNENLPFTVNSHSANVTVYGDACTHVQWSSWADACAELMTAAIQSESGASRSRLKTADWRQQTERSSLSRATFTRPVWLAVIVTLKVTGVQHYERSHQHCFQHFQRQITELLQNITFRIFFLVNDTFYLTFSSS